MNIESLSYLVQSIAGSLSSLVQRIEIDMSLTETVLRKLQMSLAK
ncbi:19822_t:CDS:2 [Cetraspora pellucida]|uniref:19822_t:CDS:1 n=1 Tax=Cetraspora pellucida TaxID=1433469 RepID=A0A9N9CQH9_9GLOM|nr:19822_t:CDS:2 [Cetraspora pellucida]